ncbi:TPA: SIR2 family protein [Pseudomonas aeruginosa]|nr:SIR2 family protein [Pseudomonas aeruginosa]HDP3600446.1 SIR2 family protein [Pseudomonas aeruginosa]
MKVLSANTGGNWLEPQIPAPPVAGEEPKPDAATQEARRIVSDLFRCNNLVVLSGLGTSMCVRPHPGGGAPPTMKDLWDRVSARINGGAIAGVANFDQVLTTVGYAGRPNDIESLLSRCRLAESFLLDPQHTLVSSFIKLAEQEIAQATNFVWPNHALPVHTEFLRRAARRTNRKARAKVFTTNYDRCFEEAGRQGRYVVIDGFSHTSPPTFDAVHFTYDIVRRSKESDTQDFIPNVFHLYKLHGSIDWTRDETTGEIYKWPGTDRPLLIYPRNSKYELAFEQPYLEMIAAFQAALREPNTGLVVIGFGFNDNHLAEPIMSALRSNLSLKAVTVGPWLAPWVQAAQNGPGEAETNRYLKRIKDLANAGDARLALINCGFEDFISYVPDLAAESDMEQHIERLRRTERP